MNLKMFDLISKSQRLSHKLLFFFTSGYESPQLSWFLVKIDFYLHRMFLDISQRNSCRKDEKLREIPCERDTEKPFRSFSVKRLSSSVAITWAYAPSKFQKCLISPQNDFSLTINVHSYGRGNTHQGMLDTS